MQADFPAILDACVLAPPRVCDLFLRLAEHPRLYLPKWSAELLDEVRRTQMGKLSVPFPEDLADYWREQVAETFPEAMIEGYEHLIEHMKNQEKDRHVLAAAVHAKVDVIVTFNLRDFQKEALDAKSGAFRTRIPEYSEHGFRSYPNTDSGIFRTR